MDFEGRSPTDSDFHGIKQLLHQLFLKSHINTTEMSDLIIGQNYVGSVVVQSEVDEEMDSDEEDGDAIFGITTALNITTKKEVKCIEELRSHILEKAEKNASEACLTYLRDVLGDDGRPIGFLINERFINIPAQISVPLLENLYTEVKKANDKKMSFNFAYYIAILKFYRQEAKKGRKPEDFFSNPEEEVLLQEAATSFEYSVKNEADTGVSGDWLEGDSSLTPYRKVVMFDAAKLPHIILTIKQFINEQC